MFRVEIGAIYKASESCIISQILKTTPVIAIARFLIDIITKWLLFHKFLWSLDVQLPEYCNKLYTETERYFSL